MKRSRSSYIGLRGLILMFVLLAVVATLGNSLWVAYGVQRQALIQSALRANQAYASKVASSIGEFLGSAHDRLNYSSQLLGRDFGNARLLREEVLRLQAQDLELNAVIIADAHGKALQAYPALSELIGTQLDSEEVLQALRERRPLVSHAYLSGLGRLIVFISQPIFDAEGVYLGFVGGSVYVRDRGVLHTLISSHFHQDGTDAFVTDENHRLLYHADQTRIGEVLSLSPAVDAALRGESGAMEARNADGVDMLAGYARVPAANWAVVAQLPREQALAPLRQLMREMIVKLLPAFLLGLPLILVGTLLITRPLRQLAHSAKALAAPETPEALRAINAWYAEAAAIRRALLGGVQLLQERLGRLSRQARSDPLTGLANRRALGSTLATLDRSARGYAVLALDIDHFKQINDRFGHDNGDAAIKQVAAIIQQHSRSEDLACRAGGEEFVLLLPETSLEAARQIAERIRAAIAGTRIPEVGTLTVSIGVALRSAERDNAKAVLKYADEQLYQAKSAGRNRVVARP